MSALWLRRRSSLTNEIWMSFRLQVRRAWVLLLASVFFWQALVRLACGKRGKVRVFGMAVIMAVGQSEPFLSLMRQGDTFFFNCIYDMVIDAKITPFPLQMATGDEGVRIWLGGIFRSTTCQPHLRIPRLPISYHCQAICIRMILQLVRCPLLFLSIILTLICQPSHL